MEVNCLFIHVTWHLQSTHRDECSFPPVEYGMRKKAKYFQRAFNAISFASVLKVATIYRYTICLHYTLPE